MKTRDEFYNAESIVYTLPTTALALATIDIAFSLRELVRIKIKELSNSEEQMC